MADDDSDVVDAAEPEAQPKKLADVVYELFEQEGKPIVFGDAMKRVPAGVQPSSKQMKKAILAARARWFAAHPAVAQREISDFDFGARLDAVRRALPGLRLPESLNPCAHSVNTDKSI